MYLFGSIPLALALSTREQEVVHIQIQKRLVPLQIGNSDVSSTAKRERNNAYSNDKKRKGPRDGKTHFIYLIGREKRAKN